MCAVKSNSMVLFDAERHQHRQHLHQEQQHQMHDVVMDSIGQYNNDEDDDGTAQTKGAYLQNFYHYPDITATTNSTTKIPPPPQANDRLYSVIPCHLGGDPSLTTMATLGGPLHGVGVGLAPSPAAVAGAHLGGHIYHSLRRPVPPVPQQSKRKARLKPILIVICASLFVVAAISIALVASLSGIGPNEEKPARPVAPQVVSGASSRFQYKATGDDEPEVDLDSMSPPHNHLQQTWLVVDASFRLVNRRFTAEMHNPASLAFHSLANEVRRAMDELFFLGKLTDAYNVTKVLSLRPADGVIALVRLAFRRRVSLAEVGRAFYGVLRQDHGHAPAGFQVDVRSLKFSGVRQSHHSSRGQQDARAPATPPAAAAGGGGGGGSPQWSSWSAWSACARTDQICVRSRRRMCFARRPDQLCLGGKEVDFEECPCSAVPSNPSSPAGGPGHVDGHDGGDRLSSDDGPVGAGRPNAQSNRDDATRLHPPPSPPAAAADAGERAVPPQTPVQTSIEPATNVKHRHHAAPVAPAGVLGEEKNKSSQVEACHEDEWKCENGQCIPFANRCDGHTNCYDSSDERDCACAGVELGTHFRCGNATSCLPVGRRCDGVVDCWDDSDEDNCLCGADQHRCELAATCIPRAFFCDGFVDCPAGDQSDEPPKCDALCDGKNSRQCANGRCVPKLVWCDGFDSCGDGSDEKDC